MSLAEEGLVTTYTGPNPVDGGERAMMSITDDGRTALEEYRAAQK
ncbi:hypothetical protein [Streptomyces umbrinus]